MDALREADFKWRKAREKHPAAGNGKPMTRKNTQILHSETGVGLTLKLLRKAGSVSLFTSYWKKGTRREITDAAKELLG